MKLKRRRKCRHCGELYTPDQRNAHHQKYCAQDACRAASKRASQQHWQSNPANQNYHGNQDHCARVRAWRQAHPGYWRKKGHALQDFIQPQLVDSQQVIAGLNAPPSALEEAALTVPFVTQPSATKELNVCPDPVAAVPLNAPLQDIYLSQHPLFVGLISILTDALQEDIAPVMAKLQLRGRAILGIGPGIVQKGA